MPMSHFSALRPDARTRFNDFRRSICGVLGYMLVDLHASFKKVVDHNSPLEVGRYLPKTSLN